MLLKNADIEQVLIEDLNAYKEQHLKYLRKNDKLDKERKSYWSENRYEILEIQEHNDQLFYKVAGRDKLLMRSELLKV